MHIHKTNQQPILQTQNTSGRASPVQDQIVPRTDDLVVDLLKHPTKDNVQLLKQIVALNPNSSLNIDDIFHLETKVAQYVANKENPAVKNELNVCLKTLQSKINPVVQNNNSAISS